MAESDRRAFMFSSLIGVYGALLGRGLFQKSLGGPIVRYRCKFPPGTDFEADRHKWEARDQIAVINQRYLKSGALLDVKFTKEHEFAQWEYTFLSIRDYLKWDREIYGKGFFAFALVKDKYQIEKQIRFI